MVLSCCRNSRGAGGSSSSNARGNNSGRWTNTGVPLCPNHGLECLSLTANTATNPGRKFFKCSHQTEADSCLKFAWADEYDSGPGGVLNKSEKGIASCVQSISEQRTRLLLSAAYVCLSVAKFWLDLFLCICM